MSENLYENERRGALWVHPQYQKGFIATFCLATFGGMFATCLLLTLLFYLASSHESDLVFWPLILVNVVVLLALVVTAGVVALNISHKVGGPLYRLEKRFKEISKGDLMGEVKLRRGDNLQSAALALNQMSRHLGRRIAEIGDHLEDYANLTRQPGRREELEKGLRALAWEMKQGFLVRQ